MNIRRYLSLFTLVTLLASALYSSSLLAANGVENPTEVTFLDVDKAYQVVANIEDGAIVFDWTIADGYYLYQHQFSLKAVTAENTSNIELEFGPSEKKFDDYFQRELNVHHHATRIVTPLSGDEGDYELQLKSQGCAEAGLCYPPQTHKFKVANGGITPILKTATTSSAFEQQTPLKKIAHNTSSANAPEPAKKAGFLLILGAIFGAMAGGMILNLMPCVFPVLSLKALSFASSNHEGESHKAQGWAYTAGAVLSFVIVASVILIAKEAGSSLGWGFHLQKPGFVTALAYLFFAMGLSLSGMFYIGTSFMGAGQGLTNKSGLAGSFFTGVLAAVVASPCTAPLMAPAIGFAVTQHSAIALLIFASLGFGMALPFLALSYSPRLASALPAPGAWMDTLKQVLAFPLFVTSVWLLWVLGGQTGVNGLSLALLGAVALTFAIWLWQLSPSGTIGKRLSQVLAVASLAIALAITLKVGNYTTAKTAGHHGPWQPYSAQTLQELRKQGKPVFIDLSADWCITCKVNERVALDTETVQNYAKEKGIAMLRGDWTQKDPAISKLLAEFGRNGVPLYLMYPADPSKPAEVLPQLLKQSTVLESMSKAL